MRPAITAAIDDEPMPPSPGRRWGVAALVFVTLVIVAWSTWDRIAWHRFQAEVTRLRSAGEPVWETDFPSARVPDSENAALVLRRAAAEVVETLEQREHSMDDFFDPPLSPEAVEALGHALHANRVALDDARRMDSMVAADFGPTGSGDPASFEMSMAELDDLDGARSVAHLLVYAARHAHASGDDQAAIAYIKDILAVARSIGGREVVVHQLIATGIDAMAAQELESAAPDLRAGDLPGQARRADVGAIIADLLDAETGHKRMLRALAHERPNLVVSATPQFTWQVRHYKLKWDGQSRQPALYDVAPAWLDSVTDRIARPYFLRLAARDLRYYADLAAGESGAASPSTRPMPRARLYRVQEMFGVNWVVSLWPSQVDYRFARSQGGNAFKNAHAAVSLAARLYQIDHNGQIPATTASLIHGYMPPLPAGVTLPVPAFLPPTKLRPVPATLPSTMPATAPSSTK